MNSAGTATTNPAIGPAIPMSNSAIFDGMRSRMRMNAPECAGQRQRRRQEEGQRGVDAVVAAGDVVAHLVAAEDGEIVALYQSPLR